MKDGLTTIATVPTLVEAELAKGFLGTHGIDVFLGNLHMSTISPHLWWITGGITVQVDVSSSERARELLKLRP